MNDIHIKVHGPGVFLYSPFATAGISAGENFLDASYASPDQVLPYVYSGTIVAFQTGNGYFLLKFQNGYPQRSFPQSLRLGVLVKDRTLCFRDLYDLYHWSVDCPKESQLELADGYYHVTVCSEGDFTQNEVEIMIFLHPLADMPKLDYRGCLPVLFP